MEPEMLKQIQAKLESNAPLWSPEPYISREATPSSRRLSRQPFISTKAWLRHWQVLSPKWQVK